MNPVEKDNIRALAEAMKSAENPQDDNEIGGQTAADLISALFAEPDKKKRTQMMRDYAARRKDVAKFISENADLINAEAEAALIGAAVGGTRIESEVSYKGGTDDMLEEIHDAKHRIKRAMELKPLYPDIAQRESEIAAQELIHAEKDHKSAVELIEAYKKAKGDPPEYMLEFWKEKHEEFMEKYAHVKCMIDVFDKA